MTDDAHTPSGDTPSWDEVLELVTRLDESSYASVALDLPGLSLRMSREVLDLQPMPPATAAVPAGGPMPTAPVPAAAPQIEHGDGRPPAGASQERDGLVEITAPMLGVAYLAPAPDAPPFVQEGAVVDPGTTVVVLEVMKLMNPVPAGQHGKIVRVCVQNGQMVEHGDVIALLEPVAGA